MAQLPDHHPFRSPEARERYLAHYEAMEASWPVASEAVTIPTSFGETFVRVSGPASARPLVLLPGGRGTSLGWATMIEALSANHRTYAVDAIFDVGRSVSSRPIKTIDDVTGWVDELLDGLVLASGVNLMGLSFGGWVGAEYTLRAPQRLAKVVWLSPAGVVAPLSGGFIGRSMACVVPSRATFSWFTEWIMADSAGSDGPALEALGSAVDDLVIGAQCYPMRAWPGGGPRALKDDELRDIDVPVLYVVGENERVCKDPHAAISRLNTVAPQIRTAIIPGAGHDAFMIKPAECSAAVLGFLDSPVQVTALS